MITMMSLVTVCPIQSYHNITDYILHAVHFISVTHLQIIFLLK